MENQDPEKEEAIKEAERIILKGISIKEVMDVVIEANEHPEKIYQVTGGWIVQFHGLTRKYADNLKGIAP